MWELMCGWGTGLPAPAFWKSAIRAIPVGTGPAGILGCTRAMLLLVCSRKSLRCIW